jgi:hypothetical protein
VLAGSKLAGNANGLAKIKRGCPRTYRESYYDQWSARLIASPSRVLVISSGGFRKQFRRCRHLGHGGRHVLHFGKKIVLPASFGSLSNCGPQSRCSVRSGVAAVLADCDGNGTVESQRGSPERLIRQSALGRS